MFLVCSRSVFTSNFSTRQLCHSPCLLSTDKAGTLTSRFKVCSRRHNVSLDSVVWYVNRYRRWTDNYSTTRDHASESYDVWPVTLNPTWQRNVTKENV